MVVSGELSITSVALLLELPEPVLLEVDVPLDEQAAIPATRNAAAAMAASRLPLGDLVVNIDYPLGC
jgi:hypothetical protein